MSNYKDEINKMEWSFSRLSNFDQCKYCFYLRYILRDFDTYPNDSNFWAENGSLVHETLEKIFSGEISAEDAVTYYVDHFESDIFYKTKDTTMRRTFEICSDYFAETDFKWISGYDILGIEEKVELEIEGHKFLGYIDLLLRRKDNGKIILLDHKSGNYFFKKDGNVKKHMEHSFNSYRKQMYLYCHAVRQIYGKFPDLIVWNHFKDGGKFSIIPFKEEEYKETLDWFVDTINRISEEEEFNPTLDFFYCVNLCSFRKSCEYRKQEYKIPCKF